MSIRRAILSVLLGALLAPAGVATAQSSWSWPEEPKNLKVFPSQMKGERLRAPMVGFVRALGVRCSYCHVGKEGEPLSTYDFASDENPNKDRAREMLRMLGSINDHLKKIEPSETTRVNMWCHTCHRGRPRPTTLEEELELAYSSGGEVAVVARALELRAPEARLGIYAPARETASFAHDLLEKRDLQAGLAVVDLLVAMEPASALAWTTSGDLLAANGERIRALAAYERALELDPGDARIEAKVRELRAPAAEASTSDE